MQSPNIICQRCKVNRVLVGQLDHQNVMHYWLQYFEVDGTLIVQKEIDVMTASKYLNLSESAK